MDPSSLNCLQYGPIKLMLFTEWTHQTYVAYSMDPSNLCCLRNGPIKLKLLTVWRYRTHAVYSMDIVLYDKHSKLTLLTVLAHPSFATTRYTETRQHYRCYCNSCQNNSVHTSHKHKLQSNHLQNIK